MNSKVLGESFVFATSGFGQVDAWVLDRLLSKKVKCFVDGQNKISYGKNSLIISLMDDARLYKNVSLSDVRIWTSDNKSHIIIEKEGYRLDDSFWRFKITLTCSFEIKKTFLKITKIWMNIAEVL